MSQRIDTSSEALRRGASGESENRYLVQGLMAWGLGRIRESVPRPRPRGAGPQANRRMDTSSEASRCGASGESENRYLIRGLAMWGLGRIRESVPRPRPRGAEPRARQRIGTLSKASWFHSGPSPLRVSLDIVRGGPGGLAEPRIRWGFAGICLLASIFTRSKLFFRFLLRGPLFMVPDSSPQALGFGSRLLLVGWCFVLEASVGARERTRRV